MIRFTRKALLAVGAITAFAVPAHAHRLWLMPSATSFSGTDAWVTVDAAESSDVFYPDHRALNLDAVKVRAPDGSEGRIQNGASGRVRSTFDVQLDRPGTWAIGLEMRRLFGSFKANGEEWRLGRGGGGGPGRPAGPGGTPPVRSVATIAEIPADATDVKISEVSNRNLVFVTVGEPTTNLFQPIGKGLEMVPVTHPDALVSNEAARFRYLIDGRPAAGLKVTVLPAGKRYHEGSDQIDLTTDADGLVTIKWPMAGLFWIGAAATDQHPSEPRAGERRMSYTVTVDVLAP